MKKNTSKRYKKLLDSAKEKKVETIDEAIKKVKKNCTSKFDESIDVSFFLNLKNKKDESNLRTVVNLPNGNGKKVKVAVLCEEGKVKESKEAGAEIVIVLAFLSTFTSTNGVPTSPLTSPSEESAFNFDVASTAFETNSLKNIS